MNNSVNITAARQSQPGLVLHRVRHRHFGLLRLGAGLVTKLNEGHQHRQEEAADENVENARHVTERELALCWRLFLLLTFGPGDKIKC